MWFLGIGVILTGLWFAGIEPVSQWHWGYLFIPYGLAFVWWTFADATGITKKREMEKLEQRKRERLERNREQLGLGTRRRKK